MRNPKIVRDKHKVAKILNDAGISRDDFKIPEEVRREMHRRDRAENEARQKEIRVKNTN